MVFEAVQFLARLTPVLVFVLAMAACLGWGWGMAIRRKIGRSWVARDWGDR